MQSKSSRDLSISPFSIPQANGSISYFNLVFVHSPLTGTFQTHMFGSISCFGDQIPFTDPCEPRCADGYIVSDDRTVRPIHSDDVNIF
jgi:hypothetical protein